MTPTVLEALIILGAKYGPDLVLKITALFSKMANGGAVTAQEVEQAFSALKPYEAYGIPDVVPVKPV